MMLTNKLTRFLIKALLLYLAWFFLYESWLKPLGVPDKALTQLTADAGAAGLQWLGYGAVAMHGVTKSVVFVEGAPLLGIAHECNALILFVMFAGFVVAFPGRWVHKAAYICLGAVLIWLLNCWRVLMLLLIQIHYPAALDFNHKYTFSLLVYSFIFGLWMLWVKKFAPMERTKGNAEDALSISD
jgi:exosortase family protein XrtF